MPNQPTLAVLRGFYREQTSSQSRILALVYDRAGPVSLQADPHRGFRR